MAHTLRLRCLSGPLPAQRPICGGYTSRIRGVVAAGISDVGAALMTYLAERFPRHRIIMLWAGWPLILASLLSASWDTRLGFAYGILDSAAALTDIPMPFPTYFLIAFALPFALFGAGQEVPWAMMYPTKCPWSSTSTARAGYMPLIVFAGSGLFGRWERDGLDEERREREREGLVGGWEWKRRRW